MNDKFDDLEEHMEEMEKEVEEGRVAYQDISAVAKELYALMERSPFTTASVLKFLSQENTHAVIKSQFNDRCKPALVQIAHDHYMLHRHDNEV